MKYDVVTLKEMQVVGLVSKANNTPEGAAVIGQTWKSFFAEKVLESIKNKVNAYGIGLYTEYESDANGSYTFMCGCEVTDNSNPELSNKTIEAGKYARFTIKGDPVKDVMKVWQAIWAMDLNRKYSYDFEVYHNDCPNMTNQTIEIYVALM